MELRISSPCWPNPSRYIQAKTSDPVTETCLKAKGLGEEIHCLVPSQGHWLKGNSWMKARLGPPVTPITCNAAAGARPHRAFLLSRSSGGRGCSLGAAGSLLAQPAQVEMVGRAQRGEGCVQLRIKTRPLSRPSFLSLHSKSVPTPQGASLHPRASPLPRRQTPTHSAFTTKAQPSYCSASSPTPPRTNSTPSGSLIARPPISLQTCFLLLDGNYLTFKVLFF